MILDVLEKTLAKIANTESFILSAYRLETDAW